MRVLYNILIIMLLIFLIFLLMELMKNVDLIKILFNL